MQIVIYSAKHRELIDFKELSEDEEQKIWHEIAAGSQLVNGHWGHGDMHLVNTVKTKENFRTVGEKYLCLSKKMNRLIHFLDGNKKVDENASFYIFNNHRVEIYRKMAAIEVLKCGIRNEAHWKSIHNMVFDTWARLSFQFDVYAFGVDGVREIIGESDKTKRICRFCRKPNKPYAHEAHAIPEAIGNKLLICAEECDECNDKLREVEDNFTHLMDFRRAMYKISGKDRTSSPKIKGRNYTIAPDDNGCPVLYIKQSSKPVGLNHNGLMTYKFDHASRVVDQDIYRALVKMVIDLTPSDRLKHFQKTIDWIMGLNQGVIPDALPSVYYGSLPMGNMFNQPMLCLFFRKDNDMTVPYCTALLLTTDIAYLFVVPYVDVDNNSFRYDSEMNKLRSSLWRYFNINWEAQQFFSWWNSDIWNYWPVNPSDKNVRFRPDNDPVFIPEKRYSREEMRLMDANIFTTCDITELKLKSFSRTEIIENALKTHQQINISELNKSLISIKLKLFIGANKCELSYSLPIEIGGNTIQVSACFDAGIKRLDRINCKDKYITGETFNSLATVMWHKSARTADRYISLLLRQRDICFIRNFQAASFIRFTDFDFIMPDGKVIKSNYHSLVE